jgi:hypothetical protein
MESSDIKTHNFLVNMKEVILTSIFLILTQTILWSQDNLWNDRENIILEYENYSDQDFNYIITDSIREILVKIYGQDSLEVTHFIRPYQNGEFDNESICDSIIINLLCDSCVEYHILQMTNSKTRKWIELSDSSYISSKWVSKSESSNKESNIYTVPILKVIENQNLTQIILFTKELTKNEWKELKKGNAKS